MTMPAFLFGSLVALFLGAGFHLWRGGGLGRLLGYLLFSESGFWIGHFAAQFWGIRFWEIGPIHFGLALFGSVLMLFLGLWLLEFERE